MHCIEQAYLRGRGSQSHSSEPCPYLSEDGHEVEHRQVQQTSRHRAEPAFPEDEAGSVGVTKNKLIQTSSVQLNRIQVVQGWDGQRSNCVGTIAGTVLQKCASEFRSGWR